ncbi:MAG: hypothetical protein WBF17_17750 [Phycisphaerae bacterium]
MDWKKWKQPYLTAYIRARNCPYDVRINDIPLHKLDEPVNVLLDMPINPSVFTGDNLLTVAVTGVEELDPDARLSVSVCVREVEADPTERETVEGIVFATADLAREGGTGIESSPNMDGEHPPTATRVDEQTIRVDRTIPLKTPFPQWAWMSAPQIADQDAARAQLLEEHRKLHAALAAKDVETVTNLTRVKAGEMATAYYGDEEEGHHLIEFRQRMNDAEMELWPLEEEDLTLEVFADRRMARFVSWHGFGPILYKVKDQAIASYMNTVYCMDGHGRWMQIR